jgi:hypothetical protein
MVSVFPHHWSSPALPQNLSPIHSPEPDATPKYEYYVYFGNFRIISVVALQNVLFLLRIASESGFPSLSVQGLRHLQSGKWHIQSKKNLTGKNSCLTVSNADVFSLYLLKQPSISQPRARRAPFGDAHPSRR